MRMNNRGINMNKKEMLERLEAGYSPVAVSKEKWINIRDNDTELKMDTNSDNCGLCYVNHSYCDICSLYKATGHGCSDGAWYRYSEFRDEHRHYNGYNYVGDDFDEDERKQLAQDMIDELDTVEKWEQKQKCKEQTLNKEIDEVNFPLIEAVEPIDKILEDINTIHASFITGKKISNDEYLILLSHKNVFAIDNNYFDKSELERIIEIADKNGFLLTVKLRDYDNRKEPFIILYR